MTWLYRYDRDIVDVTGPDAGSFLQSLVSQDLDALTPAAGAPSLLLQPQGKLVAPIRVLLLDQEHYRLDTDQGAGAALLSGLARFKIRVKVELSAVVDVATLYLRGADVDDVVAAAGLPVPGESEHAHRDDGEGVRTVRASWGPTLGIDAFVPTGIVDSVCERLVEAGAQAVDADQFETERVEHGVVAFGRDIDDATIAQEAELEIDAVSFTKGCFVGQELVCRIDSRGHVNRFVRRLVFADGRPGPAAGSEVTAGDKVIGAVTSPAPGAPVALATVRREVEPGATVDVAGRAAVVHERRACPICAPRVCVVHPRPQPAFAT